jgi:hypothetical protein
VKVNLLFLISRNEKEQVDPRNSVYHRLKTSKSLVARGREGKVGIFPVRSNTATEVVLGEDDKHLDFRVWVHVEPQGGGYRVTTSTVVRTHNRLGRVYLGTIMPFHRLIARQMLSRALRRLNQPAAAAN